MDEIRDILIQSPVLHADETGVRCCGKTHWLHVVSTASHSLFTYSPKRGVEGFSVGQVLPHFSGTLVHDFWNPYDDWVFRGLEAHPEQVKPSGKRGRVKQSPETNLLRRLRDKREEVLRFSNNLQVPFDNNQAERDLRMIKVQQKVSGCFRSEEGAKRYCVISSYISTIRKHGLNLTDSLKSAFTGNPVKFTT